MKTTKLGPYQKIRAAVAVNLKRAREKAGLSCPALAREIGVAASTVRGWESGNVDPSLDLAERACQRLGISLKQLTKC